MPVNKRVSAGARNSASPASALRKGKFDASSPKVNSRGLGIIYDAFGENFSLYQVLHVTPSAEPAELRKAYLAQGKSALVNGGVVTDGGALQDFYDVPEEVRRKFQAVSLAYETLSTPELRSYYDRYGDLPIKPSQSHTRSTNVRWKRFVEEKLILDSHPDEHSRPDDCLRGKESREVTNPMQNTDDRDDLESVLSLAPFSACSVIGQCMDYNAGSAAGPFGILGLIPHHDDMTECTWDQISDAS